MKTDTWYYQLMQTFPALAFELVGLPAPSVPYEFKSIELKEFKFCLDGLLLPVTPDPTLPILFIEAQMQPDPNLYYRIGNQLMTYLKQYKPQNAWATLIIYPDETTEQSIPHLDLFLAFGNIHRVYLNQIATGASFGLDLLCLVIAPPQEVQVQGRSLVKQLKHFEPSLSQRCLELVTELVNRKFPQTSEKELLRMLGLVELEQTKAYQEGHQEGHQEGLQEGEKKGKAQVAVRLLQMGMSIDQVADLTDLSQEELQQILSQDL
jgi:predicted transposase/invertase (TIGR01784 family)